MSWPPCLASLENGSASAGRRDQWSHQSGRRRVRASVLSPAAAPAEAKRKSNHGKHGIRGQRRADFRGFRGSNFPNLRWRGGSWASAADPAVVEGGEVDVLEGDGVAAAEVDEHVGALLADAVGH